jgi:hypothetical protein
VYYVSRTKPTARISLICSLLIVVLSGCGSVEDGSVSAEPRQQGEAPPALRTISPERLAEFGVALTIPTNPGRIARSDAQAKATSEMGARGALESTLADCKVTLGATEAVRTCWIITLDPTGMTCVGPVRAPKIAAKMAFALIDAESGELIRGYVSSKPGRG